MSLAVATTVTNATIYGIPNGSIATTVTGGTAPYTYSWSNGATTANLSGIAAGSYTVTVKDATGRTASRTSVVQQPTTFNIDDSTPETGLLQDMETRDVFSRTINTNAIALTGYSTAALTSYLYNTPTTKVPAAALRTVQESDGSYGQYMTTYDAAGSAHDVLHLTNTGITVNGSFAITGTSTQLVTNSIVVDDKTIQLSDTTSTLAALDGSGLILGATSLGRSFLYNASLDALVCSSGLNSPLITSGPNSLTPSSFSATSGAGSIVLNNTGLTITNARMVTPIPVTEQIMTDAGIYDRASGNVFGYNSTTLGWTSSGAVVIAPAFQISSSGTALTSGSLVFNTAVSGTQNSFGSNGMTIGTTLTAGTGGVALQNNAAVYSLGNGAMQLSYDQATNTLNIQKLSGGAYVTIGSFS